MTRKRDSQSPLSLPLVGLLSAAASSLLTLLISRTQRHEARLPASSSAPAPGIQAHNSTPTRRLRFDDDACCSHDAASPQPAFQVQSPLNRKKREDPFDPSPRTGYLSWDDYFMALAFLSAQRSKDPNKQVGACIVSPDQIILGIGYNGFPRGCADGELSWAKKHPEQDMLKTKYPYVVHAEANALLNKNAASVSGAKVYVTMYPCNECAKLLIQAGIGEVVYHEDKLEGAETDTEGRRVDFSYRASQAMLTMAGVRIRQHRLGMTVNIVPY